MHISLPPHVKLISAFALSPEGGLPIRHVCKTNHTCSLVSGEFLSSIVFLAGACFSRLKDDNVCHCMCVAMLLYQIEHEINCLNL